MTTEPNPCNETCKWFIPYARGQWTPCIKCQRLVRRGLVDHYENKYHIPIGKELVINMDPSIPDDTVSVMDGDESQLED